MEGFMNDRMHMYCVIDNIAAQNKVNIMKH